MIIYVLLIGLVNLGLGYALCVHLQGGAASGPRPIVVPGASVADSPSAAPPEIQPETAGAPFSPSTSPSPRAAGFASTGEPSQQQELLKGIELFREQLAAVPIVAGAANPVGEDAADPASAADSSSEGDSAEESIPAESPAAEPETDAPHAQAGGDLPAAEPS